MNKINRLYRKKYFWPMIAGAVFCILLSLGAGYYFLGKDFMNYLLCTRQLTTTNVNELKEEQFVRFEATDLVGVYEVYREEGAYSYVMSFKDNTGVTKYIGLYVPESMVSKAEYLLNKGSGDSIKGCGMIYDLRSNEREWFTEALDIEGVNYYDDQLIYQFIMYLPFKDMVSYDLFAAALMPLGLLIGAIYCCVQAIKKFSNKKTITYLNSNNIDPEEFAEDVTSGEEYADVMLGRKYAYTLADKVVGVIIYSQLEKVYSEFRWVKSSENMVRQDRVVFVNKNKTTLIVPVASEFAAKTLIEKINEKTPILDTKNEAVHLDDVYVEDADKYNTVMTPPVRKN